jgi:hypothetical protein
MDMENEMDIGEAMDEFYGRRVEKELDEQRALRKQFLDGVPAKCILFWKTGYHDIEGRIFEDRFIWPQEEINQDTGKEFKCFNLTEVQGHLVIVGHQQILGQCWKNVN